MQKHQFLETAPFAQIVTLPYQSSGILVGGLVFTISGPELGAPMPEAIVGADSASGSRMSSTPDWAEYFVHALRQLQAPRAAADANAGKNYADADDAARPSTIREAWEKLRAATDVAGPMGVLQQACSDYLAVTGAAGFNEAPPTSAPPVEPNDEVLNFGMWLTTRPTRLVVGGDMAVYQMIEALQEWEKLPGNASTAAPLQGMRRWVERAVARELVDVIGLHDVGRLLQGLGSINKPSSNDVELAYRIGGRMRQLADALSAAEINDKHRDVAELSNSWPTDSQLLQYLGQDGAKWASEFCKTAKSLGVSMLDEGWVMGWFANAIETAKTGWAVEHAELQAQLAQLAEFKRHFVATSYDVEQIKLISRACNAYSKLVHDEAIASELRAMADSLKAAGDFAGQEQQRQKAASAKMHADLADAIMFGLSSFRQRPDFLKDDPAGRN